MDITLTAVAFRNGTPVQTKLNLTQRSDGSWHAKNFDDILKQTDSARKGGASQSPNCDTYAAGTAPRTGLSDQELAALAGKYDPRSMTQGQYDAFLDDLIEAGALSRFDAMKLGHHGWRILNTDPRTFAAGGMGCGSAYVIGGENQPLQSLEDADGDLVRWLESILARQGQEDGQDKEPLTVLLDIVRRMQAV